MWILRSICLFVIFYIICANVDQQDSHRNKHHQHDLVQHEHKETRHHREHARKEHKSAMRHGHLKTKQEVKKRCIGPCDEGNSTNTASTGSPLSLIYNSTANLLSVSSDSSKVGIIVDYESGVTLAIDGNSKKAVLVDPNQNTILPLDSNSQLIWQQPQQSYEEYFTLVSSVSLKDIIKSSKDGKTLDNAPAEAGKTIGVILGRLGDKAPDSAKAAVTQLVDLSGRISNNKKLFNAIIKGTGKVQTYLSLKDLVCVLEGLAKLISSIQKKSLSLPPIDLASLLKASSGLEVFMNILRQLAGRVDLLKVLGNGLESVENFLAFAVKFSGNSSSGIDGIIRIIYNIVAFIEHHGSASSIIQSFFQFFTNDGINFDRRQITGIYRGFWSIIQAHNSAFPGSPISSSITKFWENLQNDNLILQGINISAFINSFVHLRPLNALKAFISILIQLGIGIPQLFIHSIGFLANPSGLSALTNIIPGFNKTQLPTDGNPLQYILRNSNLTNALSSGCPISDALQRVPIIGSIFSGISKAASGVPNGSDNLNSFFNTSNPGLPSFIKQVQGVLNNNGSVDGLSSIFKPIQDGLSNLFGGHGLDFLQNLGGSGGKLFGGTEAPSSEANTGSSGDVTTLPPLTESTVSSSSTPVNLEDATTEGSNSSSGGGGGLFDSFLQRMAKNSRHVHSKETHVH